MDKSQDIESPGDPMLEQAWGIIANASDWDLEGKHHEEWRAAAERWRDAYHKTLPATSENIQ